MKHLLLTPVIVIFFSIFVSAQPKIKSYEKDSGYVEIAYFPNGKISTRKLTPKGSYSRITGYAKAYDLRGKLIFDEPISRMGGHGGVTFQYHSNGVIKSANSTFQPDGGIQRHDVTKYFDAQGNFTHQTDQSLPHKTIFIEDPQYKPSSPVVNPPQEKKETKTEFKQETMACAPIVQMRAYVENMTEITARLKVIPNAAGKQISTLTIKPGERIYCADYIMAAQFADPTSYYKFELLSDGNSLKLGKWTLQKISDSRANYTIQILQK